MEGQTYKVGKMKTNAKGNIEMTRKEFKQLLESISRREMMIALLSCVAWLMDEPEFKGDEERITSVFENTQRVLLTTCDPTNPFGVNKLAKAVKEGTGGRVQVRFLDE